MSVWIKGNNKRWTKGVPYVLVNSSYSNKFDKKAILTKIEEFNKTVGKQIFYPRDQEADYVEFKYPGANSPLGKQGGKQELGYDENNLFHEMGHCVGMGHQHLYAKWPVGKFLQGVNKDEWSLLQWKYDGDDKYDNTSVMCYPLTAFTQSPSILAALKGTQVDEAPKQSTRNRQSSFGAKPQAAQAVPTTEKEVLLIQERARDKDSNDMKLSANDVEIIKALCPDAAD